MAAHVFDTAEPSLDSARDSKVRTNQPATPVRAKQPAAAAAGREAPLFAAQPAVFERMQKSQGVGAGPLIGLAVAAVAVGGLVFAMSRHHQAAPGLHATTQPAVASAAA